MKFKTFLRGFETTKYACLFWWEELHSEKTTCVFFFNYINGWRS